MDDFLDLDAHALITKLAAGEISCGELMEATLRRIAQVNPQKNAIVSLRDEAELMEEARKADTSPRRGRLHGLPIAVKDLANVGGLPTSMGSSVFAGKPAPKSDIMVQRMQDAGAIVIGKTNTPEFGLGSHTFNPVFGATENALVEGCSAGGSSGGAAVALATGMVALADGSDMMGSLRNPAGWNGVYGLRPTWGLVPSEPVGDLFLHQLSTNGPMGRCPQDVALLLDVQAGSDPRQPLGLSHQPMEERISSGVSGKTLAWLGDWGGALPMEAGVIEAAESGLARFRDLGCIVSDVAPPFPVESLWEAWTTLRSWAVAASLSPLYHTPSHRDQLKPEAIWEIERGLALTGAQIQRASAIRSDWFRAAAALFDQFDAFILPTAQCFPFPVAWDWPREIGGVSMDSYHRWMEVVVPVSLIGLPCLGVPLASSRPMGLQLAGRRGDDLTVLQLGQAWHSGENKDG
ncbi:amidase [Yoonia litorea]|uniref:Amidase n=1 Tax=Yoonia litorea TaxID=1123755 RepID=A0A1I6MC30_9RHOB|nr:amidase [Yoonia litorea]SFS13167.1 amidase [Yoonia litorea]